MATKPPKTTMFKPAKYAYLRDIISLRNPATARGSVIELKKAFTSADTDAKRLRIARATQLAANRATVSAKNMRLSAKERVEYKAVSRIYNTAADALFRKYNALAK